MQRMLVCMSRTDIPDAHHAQIIDQFSQQAEGYRQLTASLPSDRSAGLRAEIRPDEQDLLLEICCGPGLLTLDFAPYVKHATGLDLTPAMLEQARLQQQLRGIGNVDWISGDADHLPFEDGRFSIVLCSAAFHHLQSPQLAFAQMVRVCRAGGCIVVRDVTPDADKSKPYDTMEIMRDPSHVHALTVDELCALGGDLPVAPPQLTTRLTANLPLEAVLATSFPTLCTRDDLRRLFDQDAREGRDRLGFRASLIDGEVKVSYPMSTAIWRKH
jgi:ubiquinone/menaquinone biosynthesis C-methylase UbiE